jgi:hypothetical protein
MSDEGQVTAFGNRSANSSQGSEASRRGDDEPRPGEELAFPGPETPCSGADDVDSGRQQKHSADPARDPLGALGEDLASAQLEGKPPQEQAGRDELDQAVDAEGEQGYGADDDPRCAIYGRRSSLCDHLIDDDLQRHRHPARGESDKQVAACQDVIDM